MWIKFHLFETICEGRYLGLIEIIFWLMISLMTDEGSGHLTLEAMRMEILVQSMDPGGLGEKKAMSSLPYWSLNNVIMTILL